MANARPSPAEQPLWSAPLADLFSQYGTGEKGLSSDEARARIRKYGPNQLRPKRQVNAATLFMKQFTSPIILILLFAAVLAGIRGIGRHRRPDGDGAAEG